MTTANRNSVDEPGKWHLMIHAKQLDSKAIVAVTTFPSDALWFRGHFPGEPILPGIAQVALVEKAIQQIHGRHWYVATVKRTRFKQIIEPGDEVQLRVEPQPDVGDSFTFQITTKNEITASGIVVMKQTA